MAKVPRFLSYVRNKHVGVEELERDCLKVSTAVEDTFFAGAVALVVRLPELEISSIEGQIKRSFNKECQQAIPILQKVIGTRIGPGLTKKVDGFIGTVNGCTNMANLVLESCHSVLDGRRFHLDQQIESMGLSRAKLQQLMLQQFPHLVHQCIVWSTAANVQLETPQDEVAIPPVCRLNGESAMLTYSLSKFVSVGRLDRDTLWVQSILKTIVHDFTVEMKVRLPHFEITSVQGQIRRVPGEGCQQAIPRLQNAVGVRIERGLTATIDGTVGRSGCPRLANLLLEGCHAVLQGTAAILLEDYGQEGRVPSWDEFRKRWLESMPIMRNSCLAYRDTSPLIQRLGIKWK